MPILHLEQAAGIADHLQRVGIALVRGNEETVVRQRRGVVVCSKSGSSTYPISYVVTFSR
jgi:hypothetical protein